MTPDGLFMSQSAFALARRLRAGETLYAAWCMIGSPIVAETIAREGFAAVVLDAQHGLWDTASLITGVGAVNHAESTPVVRVALNDFALVSRALDFGAEAIIAPMINSAADARQFAAAAKYPPLGERIDAERVSVPRRSPSHACSSSATRSRSRSTLVSTSRLFQVRGSNAATVIRPSGGWAARFPKNLRACLKLQKVSGNSG